MNQARLLVVALVVIAQPLLAQEEPAAVKKARAAVAKNAKDADAQLALADALLASGEPEDAWTAVEKALDSVQNDGRIDLKLGDIFVILAKKEAAGDGDGTTILNFYLDAIRMYDNALGKNPKLFAAHYGKASAYFQRNEKEKARKALADCLGINKDYAKAHALQAWMFYNERKYAPARDSYEIALKLDKSDPVNFVRLGHCYLLLKQPAKAQEWYIEVLKHHPEYTGSILSGLLNLAGKSYKKATPYFKAATEAAPKSPAAWFYYGYSLFVNGMYDEALNAFQQASKLRPKNVQYLFYIGYSYEKKNDGKKALEYYRKALKLNPSYNDPTLRFEGIAVTYRANDFAQFEKLMEELLKLAPNHGWIRNDYGLLLRDWAEARGASRGKNLPPEVLKRIKRSQEVYEEAAKLLPDVAQVQSDTGLLFEFYPAIFNQKKAEQYFLRSLELSDFTYRDAWSGIWRLRRTKNWDLLRECAEGVLGALEDSGKNPIAPVGGGAPQEVPQNKGAMIAQAKRAIEMADAAQK
ncbi:MAG: tetratricopeptide repeat protein [Planctomycetota bacterium]|jgi:tetratricopeptide (TPR) repeat protein